DAANQLAPVPVARAADAGNEPRRNAIVLRHRQCGGGMTLKNTRNKIDGKIKKRDRDGEPRPDPPPGAGQGGKVTKGPAPPQLGLATGGIVQVVTKAGGNGYSGDAFEYFRDKSLNALEPFQSEKPSYRRHQFGGSLGGAIVKDRMHFFGAIEDTKIDE